MITYFIAAVICFFSIGIILKNRKQGGKSVFPILMLTSWALKYLLYYISAASTDNFWMYYPSILAQGFLFLDGVLLFWYVKGVTNARFRWKLEVLHLIPFAFLLFNSLLAIFFVSSDQLFNVIEAKKAVQPTNTVGTSMLLLFINGFNIVYGVLALLRLNRFKAVLKNNFSSLDRFNIKWLRNVVITWLILFTIPTLLHFYFNLTQSSAFMLKEVIVGLQALLGIIFSYQFISRKLIHRDDERQVILAPKEAQNLASAPTESEPSEILNLQKEKEVYTELLDLIQRKKLFEDPNISLQALADQYGYPAYKVSQLINRYAEKNYHDFINGFRIEGVKHDLINSSEKIIQIAYKNGFNSKSTFNDVFKRFEGMPPSHFRKLNRPKD